MDPPQPLNLGNDAGRWRIVQSALGSWSETIRLCLILLIAGTPVNAVVLLLMR